jgi:hypothetical protein
LGQQFPEKLFDGSRFAHFREHPGNVSDPIHDVSIRRNSFRRRRQSEKPREAVP